MRLRTAHRAPGRGRPGTAHRSDLGALPRVPAGVIASNGVNGSPRTEALPEGRGIQARALRAAGQISCNACSAIEFFAFCRAPRIARRPLLMLQGEFNLSNLQDGLLATAFLVGLLIASPVFSEACKHYRWAGASTAPPPPSVAGACPNACCSSCSTPSPRRKQQPAVQLPHCCSSPSPPS